MSTDTPQLSQRVADGLRARILSGQLPPGSRLPAERTLMVELGVSRTALREAFQALEGMGLVVAHVGRGRFVSQSASPEKSTAAVSNWLQMHRMELEDLSEVRQLLEPRAVLRIPHDELPGVVLRVAGVLQEQHRAVQRGDLQTAGGLDVAFHAALVGECANVPLRTLTQALVNSSREASIAVYAEPRVAANSIAQHEGIVQALTSRDRELAARLLADHQATASRFAYDGHSAHPRAVAIPDEHPTVADSHL